MPLATRSWLQRRGAGGTPVAGDAIVIEYGTRGTRLWASVFPDRSATQSIATSGAAVYALTNGAGFATILRLDPGPSEPPAPPAVVGISFTGQQTPGQPLHVLASVSGTTAPTGWVAFRVAGSRPALHASLSPPPRPHRMPSASSPPRSLRPATS
jgi:hypothetical protein